MRVQIYSGGQWNEIWKIDQSIWSAMQRKETRLLTKNWLKSNKFWWQILDDDVNFLGTHQNELKNSNSVFPCRENVE